MEKRKLGKKRILSLLEKAEGEQKEILFYRACGSCGGKAHWGAAYDRGYDRYYYRHSSSNCLSHELFEDKETFVASLLANRNSINKIVVL